MISESHKSTGGLIDIVSGYDELNNGFRRLYEKAYEVRKKQETYRTICIIDTFFSDTIRDELFFKIVRESKAKGNLIKIILLNPFTESAFEREKIFRGPDKGRIIRINKGLNKIKRALGNGRYNNDFEYYKQCKQPAYVFKQIEQIEMSKRENDYTNVELKFTTIGRFPLYVFGQYACSGHFLDFITASGSPWCFWVDDINEPKDQYSNFIEHFEKIWDSAYFLTEEYLKKSSKQTTEDIFSVKNEKIFIGYGSNTNIKDTVINYCMKNNFTAIEFKQKSSQKNSDRIIPNVLIGMFDECTSAIIILTKDEKINDNWRPRPNVLIELGYAQAKYGNRVLVMIERGVDVATNLDGVLCSVFSKDENGNFQFDDNFLNFFKNIN